jgi:hypothetical protein
MRDKQPLKQILAGARSHWDRAVTRPAVRQNFEKVINCRTPALGAEVYASEMLLASWFGPFRRFNLAHPGTLKVKRIEFRSAGA